jgi:hypothetical protein
VPIGVPLKSTPLVSEALLATLGSIDATTV